MFLLGEVDNPSPHGNPLLVLPRVRKIEALRPVSIVLAKILLDYDEIARRADLRPPLDFLLIKKHNKGMADVVTLDLGQFLVPPLRDITVLRVSSLHHIY